MALNSLPDRGAGPHSKRVCELRGSRRFGRYLGLDSQGRLVIDEAKVRAAERR